MDTIFNSVIVLAIQGVAVIIMTRATSSTVGYQAPVAGLGRVQVVLVVTGLAVSDVLRPDKV
jgi:hypothetical protein